MDAKLHKRAPIRSSEAGLKVNLRNLLSQYFEICEEGDEEERERFLALHRENGALISLIEMRDQLLTAINEIGCHTSAGR